MIFSIYNRYHGLISPSNVRFYTNVTMVESFANLLSAPAAEQDPLVMDFMELAFFADDFEDFLRIARPLKEWIIKFEVSYISI